MHVYFKSITLENVRCFGKKQTIDLTDKDGQSSMWNLILGDNGTGKTTVLRALAFSALGSSLVRDNWWSSFPISSFYRDNIKVPNINVSIENIENESIISMEIKIENNNVSLKSEPLVANPHNKQILFGYGAARQVNSNGLSDTPYINAQTLFDEKALLINAEEWLVQAEYLSLKDKNQPNLFERTKNLLLRLFDGEISDIKIETNGSSGKKISVLFLTHYGWVPLHQLSLGYKTLLAWMVDFARGLFEKYPDSPNPLTEPAVCLVDEIDLHLHPRFQRKMIQFLSNLFPKTQFIVTAHSPLIVQAAVDMDVNLILLRRKNDEIEVENDPQVVKKWRIDQLLASDLFGVGGEKMKRRRDLLRKAERSTDEEKELEILESELNIIPPDSKKGDLDQEILDYLRQQLPAEP